MENLHKLAEVRRHDVRVLITIHICDDKIFHGSPRPEIRRRVKRSLLRKATRTVEGINPNRCGKLNTYQDLIAWKLVHIGCCHR